VNIVAQMCERGHADKMVLSHDTNFYFAALAPPRLVAISAPAKRGTPRILQGGCVNLAVTENIDSL
jgi:hypothetical protein